MSNILVLHAYSADNYGDGLLVSETLSIIREAFGDECNVTLAASHPESFKDLDVILVDSAPKLYGYSWGYLRTLFRIKDFDAVVGVGGGYLRAGNLLEAFKTILVQGPQLVAAASRRSGTVYLPQSIGPIRFGLNPAFSALLSKLDTVMLRDDRSIQEMANVSATRCPDLAIGEVVVPSEYKTVSTIPVLSVRAVRGHVPDPVLRLAELVQDYDAYIQSTWSGNDDTGATQELSPHRLVGRDELLAPEGDVVRVVVAMRLHAALMALRAGHYVIHLAYERKGFGAFDDLCLSDYVHNSNSFSAETVLEQMDDLLTNENARRKYREDLSRSANSRAAGNAQCVQALRMAAS